VTFRVVIDTNIWIRSLLRGRVTLPVLEAFNDNKFQLVMSQPLMDELHDDLRADDALRTAMESYAIQLLGVNSFLQCLEDTKEI
jgi:predicted nucleic acid-binding protein